MTYSKDIQQRLVQIAKTPGKNDKLALLKDGVENIDHFIDVLKAAYDPFKTYGISRRTLLGMAFHPIAMRCFSSDTWLLLSRLASRDLSGTAAYDAVLSELGMLDGDSADLLINIISKDLRAGFTDGSVNKVAPGTIADFPYMRCSLGPKSNMEKWDWAQGIFSQEKADGMFANCSVERSGTVTFTSRQGQPFPEEQFAVLADEVRVTINPGTQLHGELLVQRAGQILPREVSNGVLNHLRDGGALANDEELLYLVWDQIPLAAVKTKGKYDVPFIDRLQALDVQLARGEARTGPVRIIETRMVFSKVDALSHYRSILEQGKEGTILKSLKATWKDGTSKDQVKLKLEVLVELEVIDFIEGTGKYAGSLGSMTCRSACGELQVNVNGRSDDMRNDVWVNKDEWRGAIVTVKANSIMTPKKEGGLHSLFLPVFIERRDDKSVADTLARIKEQFEAAVSA